MLQVVIGKSSTVGKHVAWLTRSAYLIDFYLSSSKWISTKTSQIPNLVWMGLFAAITQNVLKWMHTKSPNQTNPGGTARSGTAGDYQAADPDGDKREKMRNALKESRSKGAKNE